MMSTDNFSEKFYIKESKKVGPDFVVGLSFVLLKMGEIITMFDADENNPVMGFGTRVEERIVHLL